MGKGTEASGEQQAAQSHRTQPSPTVRAHAQATPTGGDAPPRAHPMGLDQPAPPGLVACPAHPTDLMRMASTDLRFANRDGPNVFEQVGRGIASFFQPKEEEEQKEQKEQKEKDSERPSGSVTASTHSSLREDGSSVTDVDSPSTSAGTSDSLLTRLPSGSPAEGMTLAQRTAYTVRDAKCMATTVAGQMEQLLLQHRHRLNASGRPSSTSAPAPGANTVPEEAVAVALDPEQWFETQRLLEAMQASQATVISLLEQARVQSVAGATRGTALAEDDAVHE